MQHYNQGYDELYHYGVMGMKWGKRQNLAASVINKISSRNKVSKFNDEYTKRRQTLDKKRFSPGGVKRINDGLNKGVSYEKAVKREKVVSASKKIALGLFLVDGIFGYPMIRSMAVTGIKSADPLVKSGKQSVNDFMKKHQSESAHIKQSYDDLDKYKGVSKNTGYVVDNAKYKIL